MDQVINEIKSLGDNVSAQVKAVKEEFAAQVQTLNEELAKKGATLEDVQGEVLELKKNNGKIRMAEEKAMDFQAAVMKGITENFDSLKGIRKGQGVKFDVKAVADMTGANNSLAAISSRIVPSYSTTIADAPGSLLHFRNIAPVVQSATGQYIFPRYSGGEGAFASQTTHASAKAQVDMDFTMVSVTCDYLAGFVRVAKQMMQDLPFLQSYVPGRLQEDYLSAEDAAFYTALSGAATGSSTITGTPTVDAEQILGWVANLKAANHVPNGIVLNPKDWYKILVTKPSSYSVPGGFQIGTDGNIRIAGVPVFESTFIAEDKVLVGDWSKVNIIQAEGLSIEAFEQDADNVTKNLVTVRAEARVGLAVLRPEAFVFGDLGNVA
jgi:HK97 family phage major capsid protein